MKKTLKLLAIVIAALIILIQLYRPERYFTAEMTSDHITKKINVPSNVESILRRSCFDCHSNHTNWPWYSAVAPVSWFVISDVDRGRKKMNFSEWGKYSKDKQGIKLDKICDEITEGEMPLKQYLYIHKDAVLSQEQKNTLCSWAKEEAKKLEDEDE
jgi:Haem-binding domain